MKQLICPVESGKVLSPCAGRFISSVHGFEPVRNRIGFVYRLDEKIEIVVEARESVHLTVSDGQWLMVGDELGALRDIQIGAETEKEEKVEEIQAPLDGFVHFSDENGELYVHPGAILHPGDIVAVLEWMKVRMEIEYNGSQEAEFEGYFGCDNRAVRRGEVIGRVYRRSR